MKTMYRVVEFRMYDTKREQSYDFIGYFATTKEVMEFINDNRADGDYAYPVSFSYCFGYPFI